MRASNCSVPSTEAAVTSNVGYTGAKPGQHRTENGDQTKQSAKQEGPLPALRDSSSKMVFDFSKEDQDSNIRRKRIFSMSAATPSKVLDPGYVRFPVTKSEGDG